MPRSPRQPKETPDSAASTEDGLAATLSFRQAQAAFELCLAELQAGDLDVEAMAGLYRRALAYSARCEELLQQVEQEVMQWNAERPDDPPEPFTS
jgi:exodeoxyribonuclease VII small subunit